VLAGEKLIARFDLKAERKQEALAVLCCRFESTGNAQPATTEEGGAAWSALARYATALGLEPVGWRL
jgi:uncharacterized protein YcaQ